MFVLLLPRTLCPPRPIPKDSNISPPGVPRSQIGPSAGPGASRQTCLPAVAASRGAQIPFEGIGSPELWTQEKIRTESESRQKFPVVAPLSDSPKVPSRLTRNNPSVA